MSKIRLHGTSSGYTEIAPVAASGNNTLTLPNDGTIISKDAAGAVGVTSVVTDTIKVGTAVTIGESGVNVVGVVTASSGIVGLTSTGLPAGSIIQYKSVSLYGDNSTSSNSFVALPNMPSLDITPTVATSLMFLTISSTIFNGSNNRGVQVTVYKKVGSGSYADLRTDGDNGGMIGFHGDAGDNNTMSPFCLTHEDDHNTTDALSYKIYLRSTNSDSNAHLGRAAGGNYTKTTFSVLEVATT